MGFTLPVIVSPIIRITEVKTERRNQSSNNDTMSTTKNLKKKQNE
jgi:hypothetical protein